MHFAAKIIYNSHKLWWLQQFNTSRPRRHALDLGVSD